MKTTTHFTSLFLLATILLATSCKKTDNIAAIDSEDQTTLELSTGQAMADNATEDANAVFMEAAAIKNLLGSNTQAVITTNSLSGASVSVTPANGFPKTVVINFGTGYTTPNGITHTGKINVLISDSVRKPGSTSVITFTNYYVNGFKKEGTITWTNTSTASTKGWQRKVENGKITAPDGRYWLHNGIRDAVQIAGANTPNTLLDDVFLITGNQTVTNAAGKTKNAYITEALQKKAVCDNIGSGKLKLEGDNHYAVIDFGTGDCDKTATISIDGGGPKTITLR